MLCYVLTSMVVVFLILDTSCALRTYSRATASSSTSSFLSMVASSIAPAKSDTEPRDYRQMRPIPCTGSYQGEDGRSYTSLFLAFENMVVKEREDGVCICKNIIAVPINDGFEPAIIAAMKIGNAEQSGIFTRGWSGQTITDRDNGLWDNLANVFTWASKREAQRKIYSALRMRATCYSPYHGIAESLDEHCDMQITGLLVEVADRPSQYSLALGAAILLTKKEAIKATGKKWKMNAVRSKQILKDIRFSDDAKLVKCGMDELIGIAFATSLPIVIPESVYEALNVDGMLQKIEVPGSNDGGKLVMKSPHFSSLEQEKAWRQMKMQVRADVEAKRRRAAKLIPKAMEIKDATSFLKMRVSEKRACLRATGVFELPRPREGPLAVDAMMIPLLDEEVAYEGLLPLRHILSTAPSSSNNLQTLPRARALSLSPLLT